MKKSLFCLSLILFLCFFSCRNSNHSSVRDEMCSSETSVAVDTTPKATVILWVDKYAKGNINKREKPIHIRTVKAKVNIDSTGSVTLLSFVKSQSVDVQNYLKKRLEMFRVTPIMLDSGYVKPGIQYVQLRYVPQKMY